MEPENFILAILEWSKIDPHGVFTSSVGGLLSLLFLEGEDFSWRRLFATWMLCWGLGGFSQGVIERYLNGNWVYIANAGLGFIFMDLANTVRSGAPTIARTVFDGGMTMLRRALGVKIKTDDK